jgi:hypothetical protein
MPEPTIDVAPFYNNGMSWSEFLERAGENRERMESFYDAFDFDEETLTFFNGRTPLQVLAIAEDWCPDVAQNLAVVARIADEVPGMELSIVRREDHPDLMAEYATGDLHRIPVIAFYDLTFRELARWAGRCREADAWIFDEVLGGARDVMSLKGDAAATFNQEYDRRYRDKWVWKSISEWQHLLEDQDY